MRDSGAPAYGMLGRGQLVLFAIAGLLVAVMASALVGGFAGREEGFDWELASIFGTAVGTTALALATGALAYAASGDVRATWELARLTQEDQQLRDRPVVVMTSTDWRDE